MDQKLRSINHYQLLNQVMKLISQKENRIHGLFDMKREGQSLQIKTFLVFAQMNLFNETKQAINKSQAFFVNAL